MARDVENNRANQVPAFKAILIGGPCDGQTFSLYEERSTLLAIDYSKIDYPVNPAVKPAEFGLKPPVHLYELRSIAGIPLSLKSQVRTYFYDKEMQGPYD